MIRQKQSLVHKVPSGVVIMSHVYGVAAITHHPYQVWYVYLGKYEKTRNSCLLLVEKMEWESPPSILVIRNLNWSQRSGTETGSVKGKY